MVQNGTPNMSVNIGAGRAVIRYGNASSNLAGASTVFNDALTNVAIAASDPTNPRIDLVCVEVRSATEYGQAANDARFVVIQGTPAAVPVVPSLASNPNALVLVQVAVAAATTSIVNANITDRRTFAYGLGGVAFCGSSALPSGSSLRAGLEAFEIDTLRKKQYDGTGWVIMNEPPVTASGLATVPLSGAGATFSTREMRYTRSDGWCNFSLYIQMTANGTGAGSILVTLPINADNTNTYTSIASGRETSTGKMLQGYLASATQMSIIFYDNTYPGSATAGMFLHGRYRMATRYS